MVKGPSSTPQSSRSFSRVPKVARWPGSSTRWPALLRCEVFIADSAMEGGMPPLEKVAAPAAVNVCFLCFCRALRLSLAASRDGPPDMASADNPLDDLRRQIDGIDDALHDLLIRRAEIAERIGKLKT